MPCSAAPAHSIMTNSTQNTGFCRHFPPPAPPGSGLAQHLPAADPLGALGHDGRHGGAGEQGDAEQRHDRPQAGQHRPRPDAEHPEEHRADRHRDQLAPRIERMQQAHHLRLVPRRAGLDDRRDHHLDQPAAEGVQHHGGQDRGEGIGHAMRQQPQGQQAGRGQHMGPDDARPVPDAVHVPAGQQVDGQLRDEVDGDEHRQPRQVDAEGRGEGDEQQRRVVVDDRLRHVSVEAGDDRAPVSRVPERRRAGARTHGSASVIAAHRRLPPVPSRDHRAGSRPVQCAGPRRHGPDSSRS